MPTSATRLACVLAALLALVGSTASAQLGGERASIELGAEAGVLLRADRVIDGLAAEVLPAGELRVDPAVEVSLVYLRRISGLRALYGLRAEVASGEAALGLARGHVRQAGLMLDYRAFMLDMDGDCDCPTWGRDNWFKRAFFVEVALGASIQSTVLDEGEIRHEATRIGPAYLARVGVSHRLTRAWDLYLAGGVEGLFARDIGYGVHEIGVRPTVGVSWRPRS